MPPDRSASVRRIRGVGHRTLGDHKQHRRPHTTPPRTQRGNKAEPPRTAAHKPNRSLPPRCGARRRPAFDFRHPPNAAATRPPKRMRSDSDRRALLPSSTASRQPGRQWLNLRALLPSSTASRQPPVQRAATNLRAVLPTKTAGRQRNQYCWTELRHHARSSNRVRSRKKMPVNHTPTAPGHQTRPHAPQRPAPALTPPSLTPPIPNSPTPLPPPHRPTPYRPRTSPTAAS